MTKTLIRAAATTVLALSLTTGFAAADVSNTGPNSRNTEDSSVTNEAQIHNDNNLGLTNGNHQDAYTGGAQTNHNTTGGDATSGDATNGNSFTVDASVDNTGAAGNMGQTSSDPAAMGNIDTTGPSSYNSIRSTVRNTLNVQNNNNVSVNNQNSQSAASGGAEVNDNTTGGSATSGGASNQNNTSVTLTVTN